MSQLLSGKQKGRFAAPPEPGSGRSQWAYVPIMVLLPVTVVVGVFGMVSATTYFNCRNMDTPQCVATPLRTVVDGTYTGVSVFTMALLLLAFVLVLTAAVRLKRWPVWLCWGMAAVSLGLVVVAFLMLNGSLATPFGTLVV